MLVWFKLIVYCFLKRKKGSGELSFGRGETTLSWGETDLGQNHCNSRGSGAVSEVR